VTEPSDPNLRQKLNLETARVRWSEMQRHFARGSVIVVAPELDLVEVAARMAEDDAPSLRTWMQSRQVMRASDTQARSWSRSDAWLWAVVVAPWVLVQESGSD